MEVGKYLLSLVLLISGCASIPQWSNDPKDCDFEQGFKKDVWTGMNKVMSRTYICVDMPEVIKEYGLDACTLPSDMKMCRTSYINVFTKGVASKDKRVRGGKQPEPPMDGIAPSEEETDITETATGRKVPYFSSL